MMRSIRKLRGMFVGAMAALAVMTGDVYGGVETQRGDARGVSPIVGIPGPVQDGGATPWTIRSRTINIDTQVLHQAAANVAERPRLSLPLFDDVTIPIEVRRVSQSKTRGTTIHAVIPRSMNAGDATITVREQTVAGFISLPRVGQFTIRLGADGQHVVNQIDFNEKPTCGVDERQHRIQGMLNHALQEWMDLQEDVHKLPQHSLGLNNDDPVEVRLYVVFTEAAAEAAGGVGPLIGLVETDVETTNTILENSLTDVQFVLVAVEAVDYDEAGDIGDDLNELRFGEIEIPPGSNVHMRRSLYCADFVSMIVSYEEDPVCGIAFLMGPPSVEQFDTAFNVVRVECMPGTTLAHELGHNMGCAHDHMASESAGGTYPFSFGHRYPVQGLLYATVMTYPPFDVTIPNFSNPDVQVPPGFPTGVPWGLPLPADNALSINLNLPFFSQFGQFVGLGDCLDLSGETHEVPIDFLTIQEAIDAASNGDRIIVFPGIYNEQIDFKGKNIRLESTSPFDPDVVAGTVISGQNNGSVVTFKSGESSLARLNGFTVRNGNSPRGGGVYIKDSSPTVANCVIENNTALSNGGGIYIEGGPGAPSTPTITRTRVINNQAFSHGGGISSIGATALIFDSEIHDNTAVYRGGGMYSKGGQSSLIMMTSFESNSTTLLGGGFYSDNSQPSFFMSSFEGNSAVHGGAVYVLEGNPSFNQTTFENNTTVGAAGQGGALYIKESPLDLLDCTITGNAATVNGGGVFVFLDPEDEDEDEEDLIRPFITDTELCGNTPNNIAGFWEDGGDNEVCAADVDRTVCAAGHPDGPCDFQTIQAAIDIANPGDVIKVLPGTYVGTIDFNGTPVHLRSRTPADPNVDVTTLDADGQGRVITIKNNEGSDLRISGFTIRGGNALHGGGMFIQNTDPTVEHCIFEANTTTSVGGGLAIFSGNAVIRHCDFRNNFAGNSGGGMYVESSDNLVLQNCTFEDNVSNASGGGLANLGSDHTMDNLLFLNNSAANWGGGVYNALGSHPSIFDTDFQTNTAALGGGMYSTSNSEPFVAGACFFDNTPSDVHGPWIDFDSTFGANCLILASSSPMTPQALSGPSGSVFGSFAGAVNEGASTCDPHGEDVFFSLGITDGPVTLTLDTCGSGAETSIAVFDAFYSELGCSSDCDGEPCSSDACLVVPGLDNGTYLIRVSRPSGAAGSLGPDEFVLNYDQVEFINADLNGDGVVNVLDLLILLENWGDCPSAGTCPADLSGDGVVNVLDLLILLENWG